MIKNMKIGAKLVLIVTVAVVSSVILACVGLFSIIGLGNDIAATYDNITVPTGYASEMGLAFGDVRVALRSLAMSSTKEENAKYISEFEQADLRTKSIISSYASFLSNNGISEGEEYGLIKKITDNYESAQKPISEAITLGNKNMNSAAAIVIKDEFESYSAVIKESIEELVRINERQSLVKDQASFNTVRISEIVLISVTVVALLFIVLLSVIIIKSITKPIKLMVDAAENMADGNLNVNVRVDSKDEIGVLTEKFIKVARTINNLTDDLSRLSHEHEKGDLDLRIDSEKYKGVYNELAVSLNGMLSSYVGSIKEILDCVGGFGDGDFNAPISVFPGKKVMINQAIEALRNNMNHISGDIRKFVGAALDGDLEMRADDSVYKGDWAGIIAGLNGVMNAISMPIVEASDVMTNLSQGDFSKTVNGDYKGSFGMIKENLNLTVKNISRYIKEISSVLTEISNDNLDVVIENEYVGDFVSIKNAINGITDKLNSVMSEISTSAEQVAAGARQISESSMTLAQGATEQASAVEELTATITSVNEQTRKNAENSQNADSLSTESKDNASEGNVEMENMLNSIRGIKEASQNISKVIKVIEDISFQTNLLALNAAVEAARAGQYGKGFSVVAEEVGSLAAKSQKSVGETTALIEDTINKVEEGTRIAAKTSGALTKIVTAVSGVSGIIAEINVASNEQAVAIAQIMEGTNQISTVVQQNSATSEESAAAAQQLSGQAEMLLNMIAAFKLRSGGKSRGSNEINAQGRDKNHAPVNEKREPVKESRHEIKPVKKTVARDETAPRANALKNTEAVREIKPESKPMIKPELKPVAKPESKPETKPEKREVSSPPRSTKHDASDSKAAFVSAKPIIGATNAARHPGVVPVQSGEAIYSASDFGKY